LIVINREGTELLKANVNVSPIGLMYVCMPAVQVQPFHTIFLKKIQLSDCGLSEQLNKHVH